MYGNNPKKLLNKIIENNEIKINVLPLELILPIKILNSLCKVIIILIQIKVKREGINQYIEGIIKMPIKVLNQFRESLKLVVGSKEENKFAIIFN